MATKTPYDFAAKAALYSTFSISQLEFSASDAVQARDLADSFDPTSAAYYADDVHTIATELRARKVG